MARVAQVVIVHPPVSVARDFIDYPYFSDLGAVQLAAVLEADGAAVSLVDAYTLPGSSLRWRVDGRAHLGAEVEEVEADVAKGAPPDAIVVAYTPFHRPPERDDVLGDLLAGLRRRWPSAALWLADCYQSGQHYVDVEPERVLACYPEAEAWVKYEAEVTVPELVRAVTRGERPRGAYRGVSPAELDTLPFPAWRRVDLAAYARFHERVVEHLGRGPWHFPIDGRTLPLVTSRGCPFTCVHCSSNPGREPGDPKLQRRYGPLQLRLYVRELVQRHGATRLEILDELVNVNERHFDGLLEEIAALGVAFDVPNGMRADYLEPRHLARMRGRVTTVSVSAESGVQRVVTEIVHKRLDLAAIVRAAQSAQAAEVPLLVHYIIGLPGETAEEVGRTLTFALDLYDRYGAAPAVQFATPLPGTELARGRTLPVVPDWGPFFQTAPSQPDALVPAPVLRRFLTAFQERLRATREPTLVLDVTPVCNNHCAFCAVSPPLAATEHPSGLKAALERGRRDGARHLELEGGEPTLHPEIFALIRSARALGYERIALTTNGRLCAYEEIARRLVRSGISTLSFSLHGADAATHAEHVGVPEAFEQTAAGIRNAVRHAPDGVELRAEVAVTLANVESLGGIVQLAWDLGLRRLRFQVLAPFGRETAAWTPEPDRAAAAIRPLLDAWEGRMRLSVQNLPYCYLPGYERFIEGDLDLVPTRRHVQHGGVDLAAYRRSQRARQPQCAPCPHASFCGGFFAREDVPDPAWYPGAKALPVVNRLTA